MRKILVLLAVAGSCAVLGGCDRIKEGYQEGYQKSFDEGFDKSFLASCKSSAEKQGVPVATAAQYCDCVLDEIHAQNFSIEEKKALGSSPQKIEPLAKKCAAKLAPGRG
jgi:hypothetical protein